MEVDGFPDVERTLRDIAQGLQAKQNDEVNRALRTRLQSFGALLMIAARDVRQCDEYEGLVRAGLLEGLPDAFDVIVDREFPPGESGPSDAGGA